MVQCDSTIDALIPLLRTEKNPPSSEFDKILLNAFVNGAAIIQFNGSHIFDPATITTFLGVYEATENFMSRVAKISENFSLLPTPISISSMQLSFSMAAAATAATKFRQNVWYYNCKKEGHTWYRCIINCQHPNCPLTCDLESKGRSSIAMHSASCCPLRRSCEKLGTYTRTKPVGRPPVVNSTNVMANLPPKPIGTFTD